MKAKYLAAGVVIATVLLTTSTNRNEPSKLERQFSTPKTETATPYNPESNEPNKDPNTYDPNSNMKAIIEPRDEIYDSRNRVAF